MNLRRIGIWVGLVAGVANELQGALTALERSRRILPSRSVTALLLAGAAVGALAARPDLRRKIRGAFRESTGAAPKQTADTPAPAATQQTWSMRDDDAFE